MPGTVASDLDPILTSRRIALWVEDNETKGYLDSIWNSDPDLNLLVAIGKDSVRSIVKKCRAEGYRNVFGLVDRDFENTGNSVGPEVFVTVFPEIENYILNWDSLENCELNRQRKHWEDAASFRNKAEVRARSLIWPISCRFVLNDLRMKATQDFPCDPGLTVNSFESALSYITSCPWFGSQLTPTERPFVEERLRYHESELHIGTGFIEKYPGKELLNSVLWNYKDSKGWNPREDIIKSVGRWQGENGRVDPFFIEIQQVMKLAVR